MPLHQSWIFWFQAGIAIVATVWYSSDFMTDAVLKMTRVSPLVFQQTGNKRRTWRTCQHVPVHLEMAESGDKKEDEEAGERAGSGSKCCHVRNQRFVDLNAAHCSYKYVSGQKRAIIAGQHAEESDISHSTKLAALEAGGESVNVKRPTGYWTCCGPYSARGVGFVSSTSWCFFFTG